MEEFPVRLLDDLPRPNKLLDAVLRVCPYLTQCGGTGIQIPVKSGRRHTVNGGVRDIPAGRRRNAGKLTAGLRQRIVRADSTHWFQRRVKHVRVVFNFCDDPEVVHCQTQNGLIPNLLKEP